MALRADPNLRVPPPALRGAGNGVARGVKEEQAAYEQYRADLLTRYEKELTHLGGQGAAQVATWTRKRLWAQLLLGSRLNPERLAQLKQQFPGQAAEIDAVAGELTQQAAALAVRAKNANPPDRENLTWPAINAVAATLAAQNQAGPAARQQTAVDLIAKFRLTKAENYAAIEGSIPGIYQEARSLSSEIKPEELGLIRLELLSLPLADTNRVTYVRNLAIELQGLITTDGKAIRGQVHNAAGPANVPFVARYLNGYWKADAQGRHPGADAISVLMLARDRAQGGDLEGAKLVFGTVKKHFQGYAEFAELVKGIDNGQGAAAAFDNFVQRNLKVTGLELDPTRLVTMDDGRRVPDPIQAEVKTLIRAIDDKNPQAAQQSAATIHAGLQGTHQAQFQGVLNACANWVANAANPAHLQAVVTAMSGWGNAVEVPRLERIQERLTKADGTPLAPESLAKIGQALDHLAAGRMPEFKQSWTPMIQALAGSALQAGLNQYTQHMAAQYTSANYVSWIRPQLTPLMTNNLQVQAGQNPVEVFSRLNTLFREISELYDAKADIAKLEHNFPIDAPPSLRLPLFQAIRALRNEDSVGAALSISEARVALREIVAPSGGPQSHVVADQLTQRLVPIQGELNALAQLVKTGAAAALVQLDEILSKYATGANAKRSISVVEALGENGRKEQLPPAGLKALNELLEHIQLGRWEGAINTWPGASVHLAAYSSFPLLAQAIHALSVGQPAGQALQLVDEFLQNHGAQRALVPGNVPMPERLRPDRQGVVQQLGPLFACLEKCRANDLAGARAAMAGLRIYAQYPNHATTLALAVAKAPQAASATALVPYLEEFLLGNLPVTGEQVLQSFRLPDGTRPDDATLQLLLQLKDLIEAKDHQIGKDRLPLIQLDGVLEQISTNLLANLGERFGNLQTAQVGEALLTLRAAIDSAIASGLEEVNVAGGGATKLLPFSPAKAEGASLRTLREQLDKLLSKEITNADLPAIQSLASGASERVWYVYQQLQSLFGPRLAKAQAQKAVSDPAFVDNLLKSGPFTHLKSIADTVNVWAGEQVGKEFEAGVAIQNPVGLRVMTPGRAVLNRVVIAESIEKLPKKCVLDEGTLLVLGTVGNENISVAGSVVVDRAPGDGAGAGGQLSHIFVWTRNTGVAGATFNGATEALKPFLKAAEDGKELYLETGDQGFRLTTVEEAVARRWMRADEKEALRPSVNSFVRFMTPVDGALVVDPESMHLSRKAEGKPLLMIDLAHPLLRFDGLGAQPASFAELLAAGPNGRFADSLVGPKAGTLARLRQALNWAAVIGPGHTMPFGQVQGLLERTGITDELRRLEPSLGKGQRDFWASRFMTEAAYRRDQCDKIQAVYRERLSAHLLEPDGAGGVRPSAAAIAEILTPLKANPELVLPDGRLKPLIARSTSNAEDAPDFNAAGKHRTIANVTNDTEVVKAAIEVMTSLWNYEAVENRRIFGVDSRLAAMSVLFQPMEDAQVSGVLVTTDDLQGKPNTHTYQAVRGLFGAVHGAAQPQLSRLENGVGRPEIDYAAKAMVVMDPAGGTKEVPVDPAAAPGPLLTAAQEKQLYTYANQIKKHFNEVLFPGRNLDVDIEFMVVGGAVKITQARPLPRPRTVG